MEEESDPEVFCENCKSQIWRRNDGYWEDRNSMTTCDKSVNQTHQSKSETIQMFMGWVQPPRNPHA